MRRGRSGSRQQLLGDDTGDHDVEMQVVDPRRSRLTIERDQQAGPSRGSFTKLASVEGDCTSRPVGESAPLSDSDDLYQRSEQLLEGSSGYHTFPATPRTPRRHRQRSRCHRPGYFLLALTALLAGGTTLLSVLLLNPSHQQHSPNEPSLSPTPHPSHHSPTDTFTPTATLCWTPTAMPTANHTAVPTAPTATATPTLTPTTTTLRTPTHTSTNTSTNTASVTATLTPSLWIDPRCVPPHDDPFCCEDRHYICHPMEYA